MMALRISLLLHKKEELFNSCARVDVLDWTIWTVFCEIGPDASVLCFAECVAIFALCIDELFL